jgi:RNA polymerase sigma-70 factor (ECF subfamily)
MLLFRQPLSLFQPFSMRTHSSNKNRSSPSDQPEGLSDVVLMERYAATGDQAVLLTLIGRYEMALYGHCLHLMLGSEEDARDLYQETVVKAIQRIKRIPPPDRFSGYLFRIAINGSIDRFRRQKRAGEYVLELRERLRIEQQRLVEKREHPMEVMETLGEQQALLRNRLEQLDNAEATAVRLFFLRGNSYQQIADRTGGTLSSVKNTLQRARRKLRKWVKLHQGS